MNIKKINANDIIDGFVIMTGLSFMLSLLVEFISQPLQIGRFFIMFAILFVFHLYRFPKGFFNVLGFIRQNNIIIYFLLIYLIDSIINYLFFERWGKCLYNFAILFIFLSYLYNCYLYNEKKIKKIINYYLYYCIWNGLSIVILVLLVPLGLSWERNDITDIYELFSGHSEWTMRSYFPYYLSVASNYHPSIGFPVFSGLSHEPHVIMYILSPAFFILMGIIERRLYKYLLCVAFLIIILDTTSTTAIISFLLCLVIEFGYLFVVKKNIFISILGLIIICMGGFIFVEYALPIIELMENKIGSSSQDTSTNMLGYLLSFDLIGEGNVPEAKGFELTAKAGIVGILDIILFIWMLYKILFLIISRERYYHYVGIAALYFLLHNLKVSYLSFSYPYLAFILFIIIIETKSQKSVSHEKISDFTHQVVTC